MEIPRIDKQTTMLNFTEKEKLEVMLELVQAEDFSGKATVLDGKHFHNCRFDKKATLIYEGGEWAETNCTFEPGIQLSFTGAAARTMQVMARFGMLQPIPMPGQQPIAVKNPPRGPVH